VLRRQARGVAHHGSDLVAALQQVGKDGGANKTGGANEGDVHGDS